MTSKLLSRKLFFLISGLLPVLLLLLQTAGVNDCGAECFYVTGNMSADISTEQTVKIEITGALKRFTYRYFHLPDYTYITNSEKRKNFSLGCSLESDTREEGTDEFGNPYTDLVWRDISDVTMYVNITQEATTTATLAPLTGSDPFPVDRGNIPDEVQQYLEATDLVQADDPLIKAKARELVAGCACQLQAVENIIKWLINNIEYGSISASDARSAFDQKKGVCTNISHLACALLRAEGIPVRYVSGISSYRVYKWSVGHTTYSSTWYTGSHSWVEVFYPDLGWIPYDGQRDIHHIDVFRVKRSHSLDNHGMCGMSWSWSSGSPSVRTVSSVDAVDISNDIVNIEPQYLTDETAPGNYALSLEVILNSRCGDADMNGYVDIFDALLVAEYDVGMKIRSEVPGFDYCDVDNNDIIDIFDALKIAEYDAGNTGTIECR